MAAGAPQSFSITPIGTSTSTSLLQPPDQKQAPLSITSTTLYKSTFLTPSDIKKIKEIRRQTASSSTNFYNYRLSGFMLAFGRRDMAVEVAREVRARGGEGGIV